MRGISARIGGGGREEFVEKKNLSPSLPLPLLLRIFSFPAIRSVFHYQFSFFSPCEMMTERIVLSLDDDFRNREKHLNN